LLPTIRGSRPHDGGILSCGGRRSKGRQINRHGGFHNPGCKIVVGGAPPCLGASRRQGKCGDRDRGDDEGAAPILRRELTTAATTTWHQQHTAKLGCGADRRARCNGCVLLGVNGSQVRILSSRRLSLQVEMRVSLLGATLSDGLSDSTDSARPGKIRYIGKGVAAPGPDGTFDVFVTAVLTCCWSRA
jgi:hypothetical protein